MGETPQNTPDTVSNRRFYTDNKKNKHETTGTIPPRLACQAAATKVDYVGYHVEGIYSNGLVIRVETQPNVAQSVNKHPPMYAMDLRRWIQNWARVHVGRYQGRVPW